MEKKTMLMRRTSLRTLGCVLMDISLPVEEALGEERSEEETLGMIRDDLGLALRNGGRQPEGQAGTCGGRGVETGRVSGRDAGGGQNHIIADGRGRGRAMTGDICYRWIRICCRIVRTMKRL